MKYLSILIFLLVMNVQPAAADNVSDVEKILKPAIDEVISTLRQKDIDKEARNKRILEIVDPIFDFQIMAKYSLGAKHWSELNSAKKKEYADLFITRMQNSYLEKLDIYTDEEVKYDDAKEIKKRVHILTHFVSGSDVIDMLYKFYKSDAGWKVYDVEIEGVSIIQTYRTQFGDVMKTGSIDDLIAKLKVPDQFSVPEPDKKNN